MTLKQFLAIALTAAVVSACQSTAEKPGNDPSQVNSINISVQDLGQNYSWGGEILETANLKSTTELTILGYPLDKDNKPEHDGISTGRFIAVYSGFLEPTDYRKGRLVSIKGKLIEIRDGKIASADYKFPVLSIDSLNTHKRRQKGLNLPFSIGIGIGIGI